MKKRQIWLKKGRLISLASVFLVFVVTILFSFSFKSEAETFKKNKEVKVLSFELAEAMDFVDYGGFVRGSSQSYLAPRLAGRIDQIYVKEGDWVKKGQRMAKIDANEVFSGINAAKTEVNSAQNNLKKSEDYYDQLIDEARAGLEKAKDELKKAEEAGVSKESLDVYESGVKSAEEAVKSAKKMRDFQKQASQGLIDSAQAGLQIATSLADGAYIKAPFDGVVVSRFLDLGGFASAENPVFLLAENYNKEVEILINKNFATGLVSGDVLEVLLEGDRVIPGRVESVSYGAMQSNGRAKVIVAIDDLEKGLILGEFVRVRVSVKLPEKGFVLPLQAVMNRYGENFVFTVEDGSVKRKVVTVSNFFNDKAVVTDGLNQEDQVIIAGNHYLFSGESVDVVQ